MKNITNELRKVETPVLTISTLPIKKIATRIVIPTYEGIEIINVSDIILCMAESNYCKIYCRNGNVILVSKTLKKVESILDGNNFVRIHGSHLVPLHYISQINSKGVLLLSGKLIPISRAKKAHLIAKVREKWTVI